MDIVQGLATAISGLTPNVFNASTTGDNELIVMNTVSTSRYADNEGISGNLPTLSFVVDVAQTSTTATLFGSTAVDTISNTAGSTSGTFFLTPSAVQLTGSRVTVKNNSISQSLNAGVTITEAAANMGSAIATVSGTNLKGTFSLIAEFADISTQIPSSVVTTDRTGWL